MKNPVTVDIEFKSEPIRFRWISYTFKIWMRTEKRFLGKSKPNGMVKFGYFGSVFRSERFSFFLIQLFYLDTI